MNRIRPAPDAGHTRLSDDKVTVARLVVPNPDQVRSILEESFDLWGTGLSIEDYLGMWEELADSPWGRSFFSWRAWVDDHGRVLSSLKLYRPEVELLGARSRARAIGAVFTPSAHRRRSHAASMIEALLTGTRDQDDGPGFLFSDIGIGYYASLGFRPLVCEDAIGTLAGQNPHDTRGLRFRTMTVDDLGGVARAHDRWCTGQAFAVRRDDAHWRFLLLRSATFFRRLDGSTLDGRFMIATDRGKSVGYVVAVEGSDEWNLREAAAFDDDPSTLGRILASAGARARASGSTTVWGWLPRMWTAIVPDWRLRFQPRLRAIPMLRLAEAGELPEPLETLDGGNIPYLDQF